MKPSRGDEDANGNTTWNNCHIDIWFMIAKYLRPEDTLNFAQICRKTHFVTNSEAFWKSLFNRYIRSKYPWLDLPTTSSGSCEFHSIEILCLFRCQTIKGIRDETIRELFKNYKEFMNRKPDPDSYDEAISKTCLNISHTFDEKLNIRAYNFKLQSRFSNYGRLAKQNREEGCQVLHVRTKHFVPVPYESENLRVKTITKTLSRGFRAYKLKIQFCDSFSNLAGEVLIFDPIVSLQLYNWWEPIYDKIIKNKT